MNEHDGSLGLGMERGMLGGKAQRGNGAKLASLPPLRLNPDSLTSQSLSGNPSGSHLPTCPPNNTLSTYQDPSKTL